MNFPTAFRITFLKCEPTYNRARAPITLGGVSGLVLPPAAARLKFCTRADTKLWFPGADTKLVSCVRVLTHTHSCAHARAHTHVHMHVLTHAPVPSSLSSLYPEPPNHLPVTSSIFLNAVASFETQIGCRLLREVFPEPQGDRPFAVFPRHLVRSLITGHSSS